MARTYHNLNPQQIKQQREQARVDDLMSLSAKGNGEVKSQDLADLWSIPVQVVQREVEYLARKYNLPIIRIRIEYPTYIFGEMPTYSQPSTSPVFTPSRGVMTEPQPTQQPKYDKSVVSFCGACGTKLNGETVCPSCGTDVRQMR